MRAKTCRQDGDAARWKPAPRWARATSGVPIFCCLLADFPPDFRWLLALAWASSERGLPSTPSMRRLGIVKGGVRNFQSDGMLDRASIRTRWSSLRTRCSMKFDLAALLSLSRPLRTGRGLAVAANSVCPFALLRFLNLLQSDVLPSLLQSDVPFPPSIRRSSFPPSIRRSYVPASMPPLPFCARGFRG